MTNTFYKMIPQAKRKIFGLRKTLVLTASIFLTVFALSAQNVKNDSLLTNATLENVVDYAVHNQPYVLQTGIDEDITNAQIKGKLADWYPQITAQYGYQRNVQLLTNVFTLNGTPTFAKGGTPNLSTPQIYGTMNLFNRDVLLASKSATDIRLHAIQVNSSAKIDAAVNVTKAFYDVLATTQQIRLGQGDVIRLRQSLKTAYDQYQGGVVDKTDYKRATITLKNTEATLKSNQELLNYKLQYLKSLMGYPPKGELKILYDSAQLESEILIDTTQEVNPANRIDYKILDTNRKLQYYNLKYARWAYLPTVQAYGYWINYYYSHNLSELYNTRYPNSYFGVNVALPLFQGFKRSVNIKQQKYSLARVDEDIVNFRNTANSQYAQALAAYKGNLVTYLTLKENVNLAREVYDVIALQYRTGVKSYLDVITAESDLRNSRINYFNSLYQVLASKIDVQKALGQINY